MHQHSIWELETYYAPKDVIIAGSGLAGLWSAYYLKKFNPQLKILIIDKGLVGSGASSRNAGFACFGSVTELMDDAKTMGKQEMLQLLSMRYQGLKRIRKTFSKKEIDFELYGGYELINADQYPNINQLKDDISWLNDRLSGMLGQKNVFRLRDNMIKHFSFKHTTHLVENEMEGQLHSGKLLQALVRKLQTMGVLMMTGIELKAVEESSSHLQLFTNLPLHLMTKKLLICTNAFARELLPESEITPARGQVLVTSPISDLPFRGTFHYDSGYYYFRNLGDRVLLGGARNKAFADEQTTEAVTTGIIQAELERFLREVVIPGKEFTIDNRWSGIMGMGGSKFPTVRKVKNHCFCALGLGGMGVALAPVVGEKAARLMLEEDDFQDRPKIPLASFGKGELVSR